MNNMTWWENAVVICFTFTVILLNGSGWNKTVVTFGTAATRNKTLSGLCGFGHALFFDLVASYMGVFSIRKFIRLHYYDTWTFCGYYYTLIKKKEEIKNKNKMQADV